MQVGLFYSTLNAIISAANISKTRGLEKNLIIVTFYLLMLKNKLLKKNCLHISREKEYNKKFQLMS